MTDTATLEPTDITVPAVEEADPKPKIVHKIGCPAGRTETYSDIRPGNADQHRPPQPVTVTRCLDCGAHSVEDKR